MSPGDAEAVARFRLARAVAAEADAAHGVYHIDGDAERVGMAPLSRESWLLATLVCLGLLLCPFVYVWAAARLIFWLGGH